MTRLVEPVSVSQAGPPDLILDPRGDRFDFALAGPDDRGNPQGLRGGQALATAFVLCLASDARGDPDPTAQGEIDLRGWPGDGFDIDTARGEAPLGSTIWTRFRFPADAENADAIASAAEAALQPLVRQGLLGAAAFLAAASPSDNRIALSVRLTAPNGRVIYDGPYAGLWESLLAVQHPLAP